VPLSRFGVTITPLAMMMSGTIIIAVIQGVNRQFADVLRIDYD